MNLPKFEGLAAALDAYENPQDEYGGRVDSFKELVVSPDRKKKQKTAKAVFALSFSLSSHGRNTQQQCLWIRKHFGKRAFPHEIEKRWLCKCKR